jgi:transposase
VYCLRTNQDQWDEATLWYTYTLLTDLEAVFRSLKSELGLRPVFHHKTGRISAHLFISVLAYHLVHIIRVQLKACDIPLS